MKLWKILLATMIALVLVCAVAMAEDAKPCANGCTPSEYKSVAAPTCEVGQKYEQYMCSVASCPNSKVVLNTAYGQPLGHAWTEKASKDVAPTCTEAGAKYYFCGRGCGAEKYEPVKALGHAKKLVAELSIAPTCQKEGVNYYQCNNGCNYEWTETVKKIDCNMQYVAGKPANCKEEGYTEHMKCTMCKATIAYTVLPKTAHTGESKVAANSVAPTCTKDGVDYFICYTCGAEYTKVVKATGAHTWTAKAGKAATCTEDGYTAYEQCSVCKAEYGKVVIPASGTAHDWATYGGKKAATCTEGGWEKTEKCKVCGVVNYIGKTEKLGHDYTIIVDSKLPTCEAKGWNQMMCHRCSATTKVDIPMNEHVYTEQSWGVVLQPTCTSEGRAERTCRMCGKAPQIKAVPAKGHTMLAPEWVKAPTCTTAGEGIRKCANNCGLLESVVIDALGHKTWDEVVAEPTCTLVGMKHVWCDREQKILEKNVVIPALGHKGKVIKEVAPTCTTEGSKTTECTRCKQTVTEKIAKLAHKYEWVTITPASPAGNGRDEYKCACGDVKETKTVKYTKWYYNNTITSFGPTTRELVGGNDWYRVTPVDLTVDGVYTYDLIASNKYIVGKVTIAVNAGALTVSYKTNYDVDVKDEALLIYASKADLATGTAVTAPVGAAINAAETFGADTKVLVSLILTGDYDAAGKGLVDASAAAGMIANID